MARRPQDIITIARDILTDTETDPDTQRQTDAELLRYVNDGIKEISRLQPELFIRLGDVTCNTGEVEVRVPYSEAQAIVDVLAVHDGAAVLPADMASMDAFLPTWRVASQGAAQNWMRKPNDPLRFFIYPPAPVGQVLDVMWIELPTELAIGDIITEIPDTMQPALVDYVVYRAESKDDEHVNSQRAAQHYAAFAAKVKGA